MFSPEFLLTSLIVVLIPGTGAIYTLSTGLFRGWRASVVAAVGCTLGIIPHLLASIFGLSLVLHQGALFFQTLKWVGALYLLYLAWVTWHEERLFQLDATSSKQSAWQIVAKAISLNLLNPKLTIFFLAFLPPFLSAGAASPTTELLKLSGVFMVITLIVFVLYGVLANGVRSWVVNSPNLILWLQRTFALTFAVLGLKLAVDE
ncbi:MAG: LysE family translocator [Caldilinea sp. CFX5]|nr:LysE family translocator [Caldilinea sp. CFX5]